MKCPSFVPVELPSVEHRWTCKTTHSYLTSHLLSLAKRGDMTHLADAESPTKFCFSLSRGSFQVDNGSRMSLSCKWNVDVDPFENAAVSFTCGS